MSLRSPTEFEIERPSPRSFPPLVIPAHAGIQFCSPPLVSLDTRFLLEGLVPGILRR